MSDDRLTSAPGPARRPSNRTYTRQEVAAARRLGLAHGRASALGGPIFWATGDHCPKLVAKGLSDHRIVAEAIEREWGKEGEKACPDCGGTGFSTRLVPSALPPCLTCNGTGKGKA